VIAIGGWDLEYLRHAGWIFDVGAEAKPWYQFYTHFNFAKTNWGAFWAAMPTQLALVFFGILHVPLNVSLCLFLLQVRWTKLTSGPRFGRVAWRR
jgi:SulP family sulfate permease